MNCITIYTDASVCGETGCAGWGAWVKYSDKQPFQISGAFKEKVTNTTKAEMMAIANALHVTIKHIKPSNTLLVVVTDSLYAQMIITNGKSKNTELEALGRYINNLIPGDCKLKINKVKAHSTHDGKRSYVNSVVDKLAIMEMRNLRRRFKDENDKGREQATSSEDV